MEYCLFSEKQHWAAFFASIQRVLRLYLCMDSKHLLLIDIWKEIDKIVKNEFLQVKDSTFVLQNQEVMLRGFSLGSWMNLEDFMIKIPGTDKSIHQAFSEVYGSENTEQFFDDYLCCFITEEDFLLLKSLGVNVLRLPFSYRYFEKDQEPGVYQTKGFRHLDRVLELCEKHEIYAILDLHSSPGGQNPASHGGGETGVGSFWEDASLRERIINLWGALAQKYKDNTMIAGYDILNEPSFVSDIYAFNDFYEKVIRKIRATDGNHIIFLEGDDWAKDFSVFRNLGGENQAISLHFYPGQHVPLSMERKLRTKELERKISYYTELRKKTGMPLWVGETGGHFAKHQLSEGLELIRDCLDLFEKHHISWSIWSYKDAKAMGMIYPQEDTKWMLLTGELRLIWERKDRGYSAISQEIFDLLERKFDYRIESHLKEQLGFRIYSLLEELHFHKLVKPVLKSIPWEEIKDYPKSFLLDNCEGWEELANLIKAYTMGS